MILCRLLHSFSLLRRSHSSCGAGCGLANISSQQTFYRKTNTMIKRQYLIQPISQPNDHGPFYYLDHAYPSSPWGRYKTPKALKNKYKEIFSCPNCGHDVAATVLNQFVCPRCGKVMLIKCKKQKSSRPKQNDH